MKNTYLHESGFFKLCNKTIFSIFIILFLMVNELNTIFALRQCRQLPNCNLSISLLIGDSL